MWALVPSAAGAGVAHAAARPELDVIVAKEAAVLVQIAGQPQWVALPEAGDIERVANASRELYRESATGPYWTRAGAHWTGADHLEGPYEKRRGLPKGLAALPRSASADTDFSRGDQVPTVHVRLHLAVLVRLVGDLRLERLGEPGGVHAVRNTDADLFFFGRDARYYLLAGGRWYSSPNLASGWGPVATLPPAFRTVPPDHERGYVRAAVPGTPEHAAALAAATRIGLRDVSSDRTVDVVYAGEARFAPVEGTEVRYATNTTRDVFAVGGLYYCCDDGVWCLAAEPTGPWSVCAVVPDALYTIPVTHPKHHVTSVVVHPAAEPGSITVGADAGYRGWRVSDGAVVHRTWEDPFPPGRIIAGRYFGPYGDGPYLAPHYGNWRGAKGERTRARETAADPPAPVSGPAAAGATDPASPAAEAAEDWGLDERRRRLNRRNAARTVLGGEEELAERRQNRRGWP